MTGVRRRHRAVQSMKEGRLEEMTKVFGGVRVVLALGALALFACEEDPATEIGMDGGPLDGGGPDGSSNPGPDASNDAGLLCTLDQNYAFY